MKFTVEEAIAHLDAIELGDQEAAHCEADGVLLNLVPIEVADAWRRVDKRVGGFWYA